MKYLINTTEVYRFNNEDEATQFVENAKKETGYILNKFTIEYKEKKQKGDIVDFWWKVTLVKHFTSEKEPEQQTEIVYRMESAF